MKGATCNFCGDSFRNRQAVRAHLKGCAAYRQMPKATVPIRGTEPKAPAPGNPFVGARLTRPRSPGSVRARRRVQRTEAEEAQDLEEQEPAHQGLEVQEVERERRAGQQEEVTRQREHERELARLRAQQEAEARARLEAAEREAKERRRRIIQRVKDRVIGGWWSVGHTIPPEVKAQALAETEKELSRLPVEDLPESELVTIAEGIRDRIYRPVIRAQDRAHEEEERKRQRRADLIESGVSYASRELRQEQDLDGWTRLEIEQKVKRILEQEIDGGESEAEVRALVDETLDDKLEEVDEKRREKAGPRLVARGMAYARRELAREEELEVSERWQIERQVNEELEREITGDESDSDVEALVDAILDEELEDAEDADDGF